MTRREHQLVAEIEALRGALQALIEACPDPMPRTTFWAWAEAKEILRKTEGLPREIANSAAGNKG